VIHREPEHNRAAALGCTALAIFVLVEIPASHISGHRQSKCCPNPTINLSPRNPTLRRIPHQFTMAFGSLSLSYLLFCVLHFGQFVLAVTVCGLYGVELNRAAKAGVHADGKWVRADLVCSRQSVADSIRSSPKSSAVFQPSHPYSTSYHFSSDLP
jgi:hypothetical protein